MGFGHRGVPEFNNGECVRILGVFQDITERKEAELKVALNEQKFEAIFKYSPVAKVFADNDGKYIDVNDKTCELLGYSHSELTSLSIEDIVNGKEIETKINLKSLRKKQKRVD